MESKVLWYPDSKKNTQMDKFRIQVNGDYGLNLGESAGRRTQIIDTRKYVWRYRNIHQSDVIEPTNLNI